MRLFTLLITPVLLGAAPAETGRSTVTGSDRAAIVQALERGALMYAYDQAAWHGTDDLRTKLTNIAAVARGWIVDGTAAAPQLVFYDRNRTDPHAVYVANFKDGKLISSKLLGPSDDATISAQRQRMIAALDTARAALIASNAGRCANEAFNTIVLPPKSEDGAFLVYFLTPQIDNYNLPFGGHYLIEISADGKAGPVRSFAKSCAVFPFRDKDGKKPEALVITHLLDPTPTEIHVFSSLAVQLPVYVTTNGGERIWVVENNRVRLVDQNKRK